MKSSYQRQKAKHEAALRAAEVEIAKMRERGESDLGIIQTFERALTHDQLIDLHAQAVREDNTTLEGAIRKALYDRASSNGATVRGAEAHPNLVPIGAGVLSIPESDAGRVAKAT